MLSHAHTRCRGSAVSSPGDVHTDAAAAMQLAELLQRAGSKLCNKQTIEDAATTLLALQRLCLTGQAYRAAIRQSLHRSRDSITSQALGTLAPALCDAPELRQPFQEAVLAQAAMILPADWCSIFKAVTAVPGSARSKPDRCALMKRGA